MAASRFFAVLYMLAAIVLSNGEECDELFESSLQNKACIDKTVKYNAYLDDMKAELGKNEALKKFTQDTSEYYEPEFTGDGMNDCMTITTVEKPYILKDNTSSLNYVVQLADFEQKIKVTRCLELNKSCFGSMYSDNNENNVRTACKEKIGLVSVYVFDPSVKKFVYKPFEFPICCVCTIKKIY